MTTYSIIALLEDPYPDFVPFIRSLDHFFSDRGEDYEVVIMANGTEGYLRESMASLNLCGAPIKALAMNHRTTQAVCLQAALKACKGEILVVCGAYSQIQIEDFDRLLAALEEGIDIISPWRRNRVDPWINRLQSEWFNRIVQFFTGTPLHDLSCTVRVYRRQVLADTRLYGNMYRFLPIIAAQKGFVTREIKVSHHSERGKTGVYEPSEYVSRLIDIFTLIFITRFSRKPLRFFSAIGTGLIGVGILVFLGVIAQKLFGGVPIGDRPILLLGLLLLVLGVQAAGVGLLGEIITFIHGRHQKEYVIEKELQQPTRSVHS